jgi:quinoprotein relay system zinc metallohydrolase 2
LFCCLPLLRVQAEALREEPLALAEVAPGLFVSQGLHAEANPGNLGAIANIGVIIGAERVAVIDSGGCRLWGQRLHEAIRRITDRPIGCLIHTHMHPDHIFGAAAFAGDMAAGGSAGNPPPEIFGHRNLPAALARREAYYLKRLHEALGDLAEGSAIVLPTRLVSGETEIDLGDRVIRLTPHPPAHTDNDLSLLDLKTGTLWAGDLLFMQRVPSLDGSLLGWLAVMEELRKIPAQRVVPGHGPLSAPWPAGLEAQRRYLTLLRDRIRDLQHAGGTMEQAVATIGQEERPNWLLFDDYNPHNVTAAFHELEWE